MGDVKLLDRKSRHLRVDPLRAWPEVSTDVQQCLAEDWTVRNGRGIDESLYALDLARVLAQPVCSCMSQRRWSGSRKSGV
jgi:hypothetical protein